MYEYAQIIQTGTSNGPMSLTSKHHDTASLKKSNRIDVVKLQKINNSGYIEHYNNYSNACQKDKRCSHNNHKNGPCKEVTVYYQMLQPVSISLMPPPAISHNGQSSNNKSIADGIYDSCGNWRNSRRSISPQSIESDDSRRPYNETPPYNDERQRIHNLNTISDNLYKSKFRKGSPNVFYSNSWNKSQSNAVSKNISGNASSNNHREKRKFQNTDINRRVYGLMERFSNRSSMFRIRSTHAPEVTMEGRGLTVLNRSIWNLYMAKAQTEETYLRKLDLWKTVYLSINKIIARYGLYLVGSTMSGLGLDSSDIDMCLLVPAFQADPRTDALCYLHNISLMLEECEFIKHVELILAKVPILKFTDTMHGFEVDLNCNNSVGIRNTHLLNSYARCDWRVRPLVTIVKLWAQSNDINDAKRMTISSYSLALMVIHFLQCGVSPPVIPSLQRMYPRKFRLDIEIHDIDVQDDVGPVQSDNKQSLAELFIGFLHYYTVFDYNQFAISIREGAVLSKEECRYARSVKNDTTQWKLLCIEEPFDLSNTARSVYDLDTFEHIKSVFRISYELLYQTKDLYSVLPINVNQR